MKALIVLVTLMVSSNVSATPPECERLTPSDAAVLTKAQLQKRYCDAYRQMLSEIDARITATDHSAAAVRRGGGGPLLDAKQEELQAEKAQKECSDAMININKVAKEKGGSTDDKKCKK
jgi:hypothetical protein